LLDHALTAVTSAPLEDGSAAGAAISHRSGAAGMGGRVRSSKAASASQPHTARSLASQRSNPALGSGDGGESSSSSQPPQPPLFLFVRRALCVVSRHAFVPQFRSVLTSLYRLFAVPPAVTATDATSPHDFQSFPNAADAENAVDPFSLKAFGFSPSASATSLLHPTSARQNEQQSNQHVNANNNTANNHLVHNADSFDAWLSAAAPSLRPSAAVSCGFFASLDRSGRSLEQYLVFLCDEVPVPVPGGVAVEFCLGADEPVLRFALPRCGIFQGVGGLAGFGFWLVVWCSRVFRM
jgi:hypothetical protein